MPNYMNLKPGMQLRQYRILQAIGSLGVIDGLE
jgi:hypothetical protein